ncbi:homeobox-DDT domain protein RLT1-like [Bidens hawaiensis]|uniref:homeobox-DDT domain protein RLT1-like n=1 Tax=Bidens hawaiensis TaxID=980011 RepID=UPI004048EAE8
MDMGWEGDNSRNPNDDNMGQSDGSKKPKRHMKTPHQLDILERTYASDMYPSEAVRAELSQSLGLTDRQLQMWFCHRRLKDKREETVKKIVGEQMEALKSSKQEVIVADHSSRSRSHHESGSGSESDSDSSRLNEQLARSKSYELTQTTVRRLIEYVEAQLGGSLREDGPTLGIEFDEPPLGAFGITKGNVKHKPYGAGPQLHDTPVGYQSDQKLLVQNGQPPPPYVGTGPLKGVASPRNDNDFIEPNEEIMQMWRKRKSEDVGRDGQSEKRMKLELEKKDLLRKKKEEQMKKEMERQDRERRKLEERMMRERQRQEERFQREERRESERREKLLQKESLKAERRRQQEELRSEKEAIKVKAAIEKAAARKFAKESMELIEDECLELLELAASRKGLTSIASLDYETLQNLDSFRDLLCVFPPNSVQMRLKRPFSVHPWIDSEENVGNLLMVWKFCMTFADILGLWPFTLDEFVQALHDYDSRILGEIHIALLKLIVRDIEEAARTLSGGPGTNQYTVANPEGGRPQIVEGAYMWGFDIRNWLKHLNLLTWPEILRQFALSAGFGPQLKKDGNPSCLPENDESKGCEDVIAMLRNGSAAENAATLMQEKGARHQRKPKYRITPGTVKFAAYHVLCLEGSKGLNVLELAEKIQKTGLRDLSTSKTPDASISVALSRDPVLFNRIAPSTYCVRPAYRKDPATADEVISVAKEKIQTFTNGILSGVNVDDVEKDPEHFESQVVEGQEIDDFGTPSTIKGADFYSQDVKTSVCEDDVELKTEFENVNQGSTEIDEGKSEPWVQGLTEGEYSDLCVEDRLNALVALVGIANEGNIIRVVLEDRLDAATSIRKQMWTDAQLDKKRIKDEFITKLQDSSLMESGQSPSIDYKISDGPPQMGHDSSTGQSMGQAHNNGYNTAERSRLQLKAFIGHKAEEMYVYRSLPLGEDRRHNRYWQFVASNSRHDPGSGRIFVELQNGSWRLIDSVEAFDALLLSLDTRGARESHLHIMLQKTEMTFKENVRINSNSMTCASGFTIEVGRDELENGKAMKRYQDLEKWMWKECLYSSSLSAKTHGKQRCTPIQGTCDSCHACYYMEKTICPRCYLESDVQDNNIHKANDPSNWDITVPIRIRLIKSLLTFLEAALPSEVLQSSWTENNRDTWGSKLQGSLSSTDLLQVLTWLESVIKRDHMSLEFETTKELLGTPGLSEMVASGFGSGLVQVLPWIPQTTAAVSLRLFELDSSIIYSPEQKAKLNVVPESNDVTKRSRLKFTFLKNIGQALDTDHVKPVKPATRGGVRSRGGRKLQKRAAGATTAASSGPYFKINVPMSEVIKQQTHATGRRTVRKRRIENAPEKDERVRSFINEEWYQKPVDNIVTENVNYHVSEDEEDASESDDDDGDGNGVGFEMENGEGSGYGVVNNESGWGETDEGFENVEEDDDELMHDGYADGRHFNVEEDSDSSGSGEYSD